MLLFKKQTDKQTKQNKKQTNKQTKTKPPNQNQKKKKKKKEKTFKQSELRKSESWPKIHKGKTKYMTNYEDSEDILTYQEKMKKVTEFKFFG